MSLSIEQHSLVEQRLANDKKSALVAYLLWFFLGGLGAHRFYMGKIGTGIAMLLLVVFGALLSFFGVGLILLAIYGLWWLIDAFLIPGMISAQIAQRRVEIMAEVAMTTSAK